MPLTGLYKRRKPRYGRNRRYVRNYKKRNYAKKQAKAMLPTLYKNVVLGQAYPDRLRAKLFYTDIFDSVGAGLAFADQVYRGNSIYDCDTSLGGFNAWQFDELSRTYGRFCVLGSSIRVDLIVSSGVQAGMLCIAPSSVVTSFVSFDRGVAEQPYAKYPVIAAIAQRRPTIQKHYAKSAALLGLPTATVRNDNNNCGAMAPSQATPLSQWYWHVCIGSLDEITTITWYARVRIIYYVELYDRVQTKA